MDWVTFIIIWLFQSAVRLVVAILRHILVFDSLVIAAFAGMWLYMEYGWGLVAAWVIGIVIFFAMVALSTQKITAIILSVIATVFWTILLEEIWRGFSYPGVEAFGNEKLIVWSIIFLIVNIGAHINSYERLKYMTDVGADARHKAEETGLL